MERNQKPHLLTTLIAAAAATAIWSAVFNLSTEWTVWLGVVIFTVALIWRQGEASA